MPQHEPEVAPILCGRLAQEVSEVLARSSLTPIQKAAILGGVAGIVVRDGGATPEQAKAMVEMIVGTFFMTFNTPCQR